MKKLPVWKHIVLIIAIWAIIIIATFAWFTTGPRGEIDDMDVNVAQASFIKISSDNGEHWSEDLNLNVGVNKNMKEISGNGSRFFAPVYDVVEKPNGGYTSAIVAFEEVQDSTCYFEQTFTFQADANYDVYLAPDSGVNAKQNAGNGHIEAAIRVAFFELDDNGKETLKCIWAPNSEIEYSQSADAFILDGNVETDYYYQKTLTPVAQEDLADPQDNPNIGWISTADPENPEVNLDCGYDADQKFMWSCTDCLPDDAPVLLSITLPQSRTVADKKMKVRVWLEGYDRECVGRLSGQEFTMNFHFNAEKRNNDD